MTDHLQQPQNRWYAQDRLGGLRRFAIAITVLNVLGHTWLGFEQSLAGPRAGCDRRIVSNNLHMLVGPEDLRSRRPGAILV